MTQTSTSTRSPLLVAALVVILVGPRSSTCSEFVEINGIDLNSTVSGCRKIGRCCDEEFDAFECRSTHTLVVPSKLVLNNHMVETCYCDSACGTTGSCCSDYEEYCGKNAAPRDCIMSEWSEWSACRATSIRCSGTKSRVRSVTQMQYNGGKPCDSNAMDTDTEKCTPNECRIIDLLPYSAQKARENHYASYERSGILDNIRGKSLASNLTFAGIQKTASVFSNPDCDELIRPVFCVACDSETSRTCHLLSKGKRLRLRTMGLTASQLSRIDYSGGKWNSCRVTGRVVSVSSASCGLPGLSDASKEMLPSFVLI